MGDYGKPGFLHVNRDNQWSGFQRQGLEQLADGSLTLFRLPRLETALPSGLENAATGALSAGIAIGWDGTVFYTDMEPGRVYRMDGCSGDVQVVGCLGEGAEPGGLQQPIALASLNTGTLLAIADAGSQRLVLFDLTRNGVAAIFRGIPVSAMASDGESNLYIADGTQIRCLDRHGTVRWQSTAPSIDRVTALAVAAGRLFALGKDAASGKWEVVSWEPGSAAAADIHGAGLLGDPRGLAAGEGAIYVGDNSLRRVLKISIESDALMGAAVGYRGPVSALALDARGGLWVYAASGIPPIRLSATAGTVASGFLWGVVRPARGLPVAWHRAIAALTAGTDQSHFQFYTAAKLPASPSGAAQPFGPEWSAKGVDVGDFFVGAGKADKFWLGLHLFSDGTSSAELHQVRVEYDQPTYLAMLPPLYRTQGNCGDFLLRYLSLFESFFAEGEAEMGALPRLFDPECAPLEGLPWLASWLAVDWDERWDEPKQREVIRRAFAVYRKRGTVEGLREALRLFAGIDALIEEPIRQANWWGVPADADCAGPADPTSSVLGASTVLAGVEPQGAVVGQSAVLDRSHLIRTEDYGTPLFEELAYKFSVVLYSGQVSSAEKLAKVQEILDREKPAHTAYRLCIVEPGVTVGRQARVGIDAVIGGTPPAARLGDPALRLAGEPPAGMGRGLRVGGNTRI